MVKYYIQLRGAFKILYFINFQINNTKHFTSYRGPIYKICRGSVFFRLTRKTLCLPKDHRQSIEKEVKIYNPSELSSKLLNL